MLLSSLLLLPVSAAAGNPAVSYTIAQDKQCLNIGEDDCVTRFPEVTGNGGDGPVQVGGTPRKNPYNPAACGGQPARSKAKVAAYSSLGYDPANPGNADKYGVTRLKPIDGWPGEYHLAIDDKLKAWRDSLLVRANKAGAKTLEADNSDIPGYDLGKVAGQLNHECDLHQAFGEDCPLKNNQPVLGMLKQKPTFWFIESGDDNDGTKNIEAAKSAGVNPRDIYIVHYGSPSEAVCNLIPGAHVIFSGSRELSPGSQKPCPQAAKGAPPEMPSARPAQQCRREPEPERGPAPTPPSASPSDSAAAMPPGRAQAATTPESTAMPATAASRAGPPAEYPRRVPAFSPATRIAAPSFAALARKEGAPPSGLTGRGYGITASWSPVALVGPAEESRGRASPPKSGSPAATGGVTEGGGAMPGAGAAPPEPAAAPARSPASVGSTAGRGGGGEILRAFAQALPAAKLPAGHDDPESGLRSLERDLVLTAAEEEAAETPTLFFRVHEAHNRSVLGGKLY